jgi:hypothetical protein
MNMTIPECVREGDTWCFVWEQEGYAIGFDQLRESSDGLHAEVRVQTSQLLPDTGRRGHVHWAKLNLSSTVTREKLVSHLAKRNGKVPWSEMVEYAVTVCANQFREGEPIIDLADYDAPLDTPYLMAKMLPEGEATAIVADGESGKSLLALSIALALRTGLSLPGGLTPNRQCPVLYLDWETGPATHKRRLQRLCNGFGIKQIPSIHYRRMCRPLVDDAAHLRVEVARLGIQAIVIDSLAPALGGEVELKLVGPFYNALRSLGGTVLIISHVSKEAARQETGRQRAYGSIFVENLARSIWEVRAGEQVNGTKGIALFHTKSNNDSHHAPIGLQICFDDEARSIRWKSMPIDEDPALLQHASLPYRIRAVLKRDPMKSTETLAEELNAKTASVRSALNRMPDAEQIGGDAGKGKGRYGLWRLRSERLDA